MGFLFGYAFLVSGMKTLFFFFFSFSFSKILKIVWTLWISGKFISYTIYKECHPILDYPLSKIKIQKAFLVNQKIQVVYIVNTNSFTPLISPYYLIVKNHSLESTKFITKRSFWQASKIRYLATNLPCKLIGYSIFKNTGGWTQTFPELRYFLWTKIDNPLEKLK